MRKKVRSMEVKFFHDFRPYSVFRRSVLKWFKVQNESAQKISPQFANFRNCGEAICDFSDLRWIVIPKDLKYVNIFHSIELIYREILFSMYIYGSASRVIHGRFSQNAPTRQNPSPHFEKFQKCGENLREN